jgi:hypothetical protein
MTAAAEQRTIPPEIDPEVFSHVAAPAESHHLARLYESCFGGRKRPDSSLALSEDMRPAAADRRGLGRAGDGKRLRLPIWQGGEPEKESDSIDLLYSWKLPQRGSNFGLSAYMTGSRTLYRVDCSIGADQVTLDELVAALKKSASLPAASAEVKPGSDVTTVTWKVGPPDSGNSLQVTYNAKNARRCAVVTFNYEVKKR